MEHCGGASVDYYCHPIVIKPTSFHEHYRRPPKSDQLISRESYPPQQVPPGAHQPPYHHPYHHHHHHFYQQPGRSDVTAYDDVMESRGVTSFTELQPASRAPDGRSVGGATEWTSTHSHQCKYFFVHLQYTYVFVGFCSQL